MKKYFTKKLTRTILSLLIVLLLAIQGFSLSEGTYADGNVRIEINGFQISTELEAFRTVYSVTDTAEQTEEIGLVYGLDDLASEEDMVVGSENDIVYSYVATPIGKIDPQYSSFDNAKSYCRTMKFIKAADFYKRGIKVRAYAKLKDGTYVYSDICEMSVYRVADTLYKGTMMSNENRHEYLYNNILSVVDSSYVKVDYDTTERPVETTVTPPTKEEETTKEQEQTTTEASEETTSQQQDITAGDLRKIVFALVSSAENSSLDYNAQYSYIEDIGDGRGYTGGIIGFTSGTGDMLDVVNRYTELKPNNILTSFLPALKIVNGSDSHEGLGDAFVDAWEKSAEDSLMIQAQNDILNEQYMTPAITYAEEDGLSPLGQYIYYDAMVVHGEGDDYESFGGIRKAAKAKAITPKAGGDETVYLRAFLDAREPVMLSEEAHADLSRLIAQRKFIEEKNFNLMLPLTWEMYGDTYVLTQADVDKLR